MARAPIVPWVHTAFAVVAFTGQLLGTTHSCGADGFYFMHIPKSAGSSAIVDIHSISPQSHPRPGVRHKGEFCLNHILKKISRGKGVHANGVRVVTLFRNPVDHVKSMFLMCAFSPWGRQFRGKGFPHTGNVSADFDTWLNFYIANPKTKNHKYKCYNPWNMQSEHLVCSTIQGGRSAVTPAYTFFDVLRGLGRLYTYGITDKYNDFMSELAKSCGKLFVPKDAKVAYIDGKPVKNASYYNHSITLEPTPLQLQKIARLTKMDTLLFNVIASKVARGVAVPMGLNAKEDVKIARTVQR